MAVICEVRIPGLGQLQIPVVEEQGSESLVPSLGGFAGENPALETSDCLAFFAEVMMQWLEHFDRELMGADTPAFNPVTGEIDEEDDEEAFPDEEEDPVRAPPPPDLLQSIQGAVTGSDAPPADEGTVTNALPSQDE